MADRTFAFDRLESSDHIQLLRSTEIPVFQGLSLGAKTFLIIAVMTHLPSRFHRTLLLIISLSLTRALASRAFTVPLGTPRRSAVSRMLKPTTWRNWKVVRKVGDSREVA